MPSDVQPPRGMRDFLPVDKARREAVMAEIRASFASFGFQEIETPVTEDLGRLESGEGGDNEKLVFRILKRGLPADVAVLPGDSADLGLRFDLTVPLSRFYATHRAALPDVFRSVQIAPVWRAERPQRGRYRQFTQCDIDVIGEPSSLAEVELLTAGAVTVGRLGITATKIRVNDRRVLTAMLTACGFAPAVSGAVLVTVDKLDKIGLAGVADELRGGHDAGPVDALVGLLEAFAAAGADGAPDGFDGVLAALPPAAAGPAGELAAVRDAVALAAPDARLVADPTLVRGMGYYTGTIFELAHPSSAGSVGGGGRYDGMIGRFAGTDVPACGFSLGFERIVDLVPADRLPGRPRRLAVLHDPAAAPGVVVAWQRHLIAGGADVRLVRRARNLGRVLAGLAADGVEAYVVLDADAGVPAPGAPAELRPIRP